ncbi:MAG: DUF1501 domain-containing protein [Planctomycetaceae bacterium]
MSKPGTLSRRRLLQVGGFGLAGLSLPRFFASRASAAQTGLAPHADSCIVIFLNGGPSHIDMWDMKPDQPAEIRGEFQPIATSLPGYHMSDMLPRLATQVHHATVVRSMHHSVNNSHAAAVYAALTGHDRGEQGGGAKPTDNPALGSVLAMLRPPTQRIVPFVHLPYITAEGAGGPPQPGFFGGFLGQSRDPLFVLHDPNAPDFAITELTPMSDVPERRLSARRGLLAAFDHRLAAHASRSPADEMSGFQQLALDLLTSEATQRAFRLQDEPAAVRDSYGRNRYGQSTLLARRLIEAGTRLVTLSWAPDANATWDTHGSNFKRLRDPLLPQFDAACASLISDLSQRGMLERTLVAVMGDFGRSPKVNAAAGRDHWNYCYSLMLVGGGFKPGLIYGSSDKIGGFPKSDALVPGDIISTLYHALGIRPDQELHDSLARPHRLVPTGSVVDELLS